MMAGTWMSMASLTTRDLRSRISAERGPGMPVISEMALPTKDPPRDGERELETGPEPTGSGPGRTRYAHRLTMSEHSLILSEHSLTPLRSRAGGIDPEGGDDMARRLETSAQPA